MKNPLIAGIGDVTHDASVYLLENDEILAAIELERLTRIKHNLEPDPRKYTLLEQGTDFKRALLPRAQREDWFHRALNVCQAGDNREIEHYFISSLFDDPAFKMHPRATILKASHHLIHSASAFYTSPFESAAILALDGYGYLNSNYESETALFALGEGNQIEPVKAFTGHSSLTLIEKSQGLEPGHMIFSDSIGVFYQNITLLLGLGYFNEGKTMGLSSYGKPNPTYAKLADYFEFLPDGKIRIDNRNLFLNLEKEVLDLRRKSPEKRFQAMADLAYFHQNALEKMVFHLCHALYQLTRNPNLCLTGGVTLNSVANGKILANTPFKALHLIPPTADNGIALGAALYGLHQTLNLPRNPSKSFSPYLGKRYSHLDLESAIKASPLLLHPNPEKLSGPALAASLIAEGKIVAWFNERSEVGPRALGNRSILADPRLAEMKDHLNLRVKHREFYRPFAPACLPSAAKRFFSDPLFIDSDPRFPGGTPYMLEIREASEEAQSLIPAVIHVDETARIQIVDPKQNPDFYELISAFESLTGIGVVLNTSFNGPDEPIVETPEDAIQCFLKHEIDVLFLNQTAWIKPSSIERNP